MNFNDIKTIKPWKIIVYSIWGLCVLFLAILVITFGVVLFFSFFSPYFEVAETIAHFRLYIITGLILLSLFCLMLKRYILFGATFVFIVIGIFSILPFTYHWNSFVLPNTSTDLNLLQLNLFHRNSNSRAVLKLVRKHNPDVITFQEVSPRNKKILKKLTKAYPYRLLCHSSGVRSIAILSRFPRRSKRSQGCIKSKGLGWMQIKVGQKTLSIASIHLRWPYPYNQRSQIQHLEKHLKAIPRPVLLAGDFNATPWSYALSRITDATDTHVVGGLRITYHLNPKRWNQFRKLPFDIKIGLPIDHVLTSPSLSAHTIKKEQFVGSDHFPIVAKMIFR